MFAKTFRNILVASSLLIGASLLVGPAALAQTTGSGETGGTVEVINELTSYTPPIGGLTGAITGTGSRDMGTLVIRNNNLDGWTLSVNSENGGKLHLSTGAGLAEIVADTYIPYTDLTATGAPATSTVTLATIPDNPATAAAFVVAPYSAAFADSNGDSITIASTLSAGTAGGVGGVAPAGMPAGEYKDTLYFTLSSN